MAPEPRDRGKEFEPLAEALGFFFELELAAVGAFVDHVGVEAVVGAVAIDHVFVGGAVKLLGVVVLPGLVVFVDFVVCRQVFVDRRLSRSSSSESSSSSDRRRRQSLISSNSGTCQ